ncbi:MAG: hypothetical protein ACRDIY_08745 [Chloroflexota bacterium]
MNDLSATSKLPNPPGLAGPERSLPFGLETDLERRIAADPAWRAGIWWGEPRPGHPEGAIADHVADVLRNVDRLERDSPDRARLRLIALVHDTFKHAVDPRLPRSGDNHHAARAAAFLARFTDDPGAILVTRTHDDAFNAWRVGARDEKWPRAEERAARLCDLLGEHLELYLAFFACDNLTGDKQPEPYEWFREFIAIRAHTQTRN